MERFLSNLHTHSTFSDGANSMEEIVLCAIERQFVSLGFSDHSCTDNGSVYCMQKGDAARYVEEVQRLRQKYASAIEIYCGIEWDYFTFDEEYKNVQFDYIIGGVHYFRTAQGNFYDVDYTVDILNTAMSKNSMNVKDIVKLYYDLVGEMVVSRKPDIVAHIDLITKFNQDMLMFDEGEGWYMDVVRNVLAQVKKTGSIVEVNTGAIARGYKDTPYPSSYIMEQMLLCDIPITISSDSHHMDTLDFYFDESLEYARNIGYKSVKILQNGKFRNTCII